MPPTPSRATSRVGGPWGSVREKDVLVKGGNGTRGGLEGLTAHVGHEASVGCHFGVAF